jgi:hypothetical protein
MLGEVERLDSMPGEGGLACHLINDGYVAFGATRLACVKANRTGVKLGKMKQSRATWTGLTHMA